MIWQTGFAAIPLDQPIYMGILNTTPDSFSDGGRFLAPQAALERASTLIRQGARILDIGGESTRPGASPVTPEEEWKRVFPLLQLLRSQLPHIPISLDTRNPSVAIRGIEHGVAILNDITGFSHPDLLALAQKSTCGLIAMRSRMKDGTLDMPPYDSPGTGSAETAIAELKTVRDRLLTAGIARERILLDPGFGFGNTFSEDQALWQALPELPTRLTWPAPAFCIGISRKRMLTAQAGTPHLPPLQRDALTQHAHEQAITWGYRVFRTHALDQA